MYRLRNGGNDFGNLARATHVLEVVLGWLPGPFVQTSAERVGVELDAIGSLGSTPPLGRDEYRSGLAILASKHLRVSEQTLLDQRCEVLGIIS